MRFYVFFQNNFFVGKHINSKTSLLRLETSVCVLFTIIEKHPTQGSLLWCVILKNESYDYEDNFQNDSSSYVLFCRYIYSDKSGRLALNWILSICCFCVDKASWNSSEISGLVNQWVFQYGKKSDDFKMILQIYFLETWCNLLNAT